MDPTAGSLVALLLVSLAVPMVCVQRNVSWEIGGVSAYRSLSTPLSVSIGDTLVLQCPPFSNSSVYLMYTEQQYDACDVNIGGGGWLLISYCVLSPQVQNRFIHITENSNTVANVPDFRPGRLYYLASFGNSTYINYFATSGGECSLGLKMVVTVSCGNNCSQCNSTTLPSRCLECNPGYCLDNITSTCVPSALSSCFACISAGTNQMCLACSNGLVLINGICTVITEGSTSPNILTSTTIIAIAAGAGGGLLVILLLSVCCVVLCFCCKPRGRVHQWKPTSSPENSLNVLITKKEVEEVPCLAVCQKERVGSQYFDTLGINKRYRCNTQDRCCCEQCSAGNKGHKGWILFGVSKTDSKWDVAYWGVPYPDQLGEIIAKGLGSHLSVTKGSGSNATQIMLSPSLKYCLHKDTFAKKQQYCDPSTQQMYSVRVVLKVRVRPSSYIVGPQSVGERCKIDPQFENEKLEWLIDKCTNNVEIESVMIKLMEVARKCEPTTGV